MKPLTDIDEGTIRRVDWLSLAPPTLFFRAFGATFRPTLLALCSILIAIAATLPCSQFTLAPRAVRPVVSPTSDKIVPNETAARFAALAGCGVFHETRLAVPAPDNPKSLPIWIVVGLAAVCVGLAVSRSTVVSLTTSSRSSALASLCFSFRRVPTLIALFIGPVFLWYAIRAVIWVSHRIGCVGEVLAPIVAIVLLALAALLAIMIFALPLSISAVAAENSDCFDAISRGISYLTQRLFIFIVYAAIAIVLTHIGAVIVDGIAHYAGKAFQSAFCNVDDNCWLRFWALAIETLPTAYCFMCFVVYYNAVYVMLRRSVDGTPCDVCALNLKKEKPRKLREILLDEKGAPVFDDANATKRSKEEDA